MPVQKVVTVNILRRKRLSAQRTRVFVREDLLIEFFRPALVFIADGRVPSVDKIKLYADLVANALRGSCGVKNPFGVYAWIKSPCGITTVQIQDCFHVIK